jgi:predicted NBD/HSP70 family sugar kinase
MAFGHSEIRAASADLSGTVLQEHHRQLPVHNSAAAALDAAADLWDELLISSTRGVRQAAAVVIGLPCPIDAHTQRIVANNILPGWVDVHPAGELYQRTKQPATIENDANLAALGEWRYGAGQNIADLIYVKASVGIGASFIFNGALYRGSSGSAGEIGHIQVDWDGPTCRCGNRGCLETTVSLTRVLDAITSATGRPAHADELAPLVLAHDIATRRIIADAGRRIGRPLADLCSALNPKVVIVGGELGTAGTVLTEAIQESINRYAQPMIGEAIAARPGTLGARAEVLGAIALAITAASSPAG